MRLFNAQILNFRLEGDSSLAEASQSWACLLGRAEALKFYCVIDEVSGTSPTFTLELFGANADTNNGEITKLLFNASALVPGTNTLTATYSSQDGTYPPPRHLFVVAELNGTNPTAHVRVWACGRGPQLLEAIPAVTPSFAAQYAAAKMIDDEDRLPLRKRALKPGASLFYPPELFDPSLTWER